MKSPSQKKARPGIVTARRIEAATATARTSGRDVWLTDPAPRGAGRLAVRCRPNGSRLLVYRTTKSDGSRDALALGAYDASGIRGIDLSEARRRAGAWAKLHQSGAADLREHFAEIARAEQARAEAERAAEELRRLQAERGSLSALLATYVETLKGRASYDDVRRQLALHVIEAFPELAAQQAATIRAEQFRDVLAKLIEAGKGRTAAKVRAYLRAAYAMAMRAGLDPSVPGTSAAFGVEANPIERLPALAQFNVARDRALTLPELRAFWRRITESPDGARRDAIMALMLLGGQRMTQLLRLTRADVDMSGETLILRDFKGRKRATNPRRHELPIVAELAPILERRLLLCPNPDSPVFSATGRVPLRVETAAELVTDVCAAMAKGGELEKGPFALCDLRRTLETHLAALGVSRDVRGQVQSHGLGGVQQRHYDRHDYMPEKRAALEILAQRMNGKGARVTPIKARRRGAA